MMIDHRMRSAMAKGLAALLAVGLSIASSLTGSAVANLWRPGAGSAGGAGTDDPLDTARRLARRLAARGLLSVPVRFADRDHGQFNAHAEYDFASGTCRITLDAGRLGDSPYRTPLAFRYLVYHELSHCELYARPSVFGALTGGDEQAARMLDDLLLFDAIDAPEDRPQLNLFAFVHEVHADVRAVALLMNEGVPAVDLAFIARLREAVTFDLHHGTAAAIGAVLGGRGAPLQAGALERQVRATTARFVAQSQLRLIFSANETLPRWLWQLLRSRRAALLQARPDRAEAWLAAPAERSPLMGDAAAYPERLHAYRSLQWWYRTMQRAAVEQGMAAGTPDDDAHQVDAWMTDSYCPDPQQAAQVAAGVLATLLQ